MRIEVVTIVRDGCGVGGVRDFRPFFCLCSLTIDPNGARIGSKQISFLGQTLSCPVMEPSRVSGSLWYFWGAARRGLAGPQTLPHDCDEHVPAMSPSGLPGHSGQCQPSAPGLHLPVSC